MYGYYDFGAYSVVIWLISLGVAVGLAFIPASIARKKGYSYGGFWVFGFFLFLPAIIVAACLKDKNVYTAQQYAPPVYTNTTPNQSGNVKFCSQCGKQLSVNDTFCNSCGAKL